MGSKVLKNIKYDFTASIVVFFVALPLCLGIALASGAPQFSGIIAGIIGGIIVGVLSGSQLGVSGPAAGLSILVLGYIASLGSWESFLTAVVLMGVMQLISGFLRLGVIAYYFPSSVIKGMLSGIGLIIILKQIPHAVGYDKHFISDLDFDHFNSFDAFSNIVHLLNYVTPNAIIITLVSILLLILWDQPTIKGSKLLKAVPGPFVAVIFGIILSNVLPLRPGQIVNIPVSENLGEFLGHFRMPNFDQLKNPQIYGIALVMAVVASLETLLCVEATDKLDPEKRVTPTNRELKAQGVGNIISGLVGGLPITQVIVRSSANINFGAKSKVSAILHGVFLLISAISIANILNMIPLATLACILLVVGYKLAKPEIFKSMYKLGAEQFTPFILTIVGMLVFDLLKGVGIGMIAAIFFILYNNFKNSYHEIIDKEGKNNSHIIILSQEVTFLNKGSILQMLKDLPELCDVTIDATKCTSVHQDIIEIIRDFKTNAKTKKIKLTIKGLKI
ncbi:MAG: SulP family inorganic anion transporter [Rickettsiales bacterium]|nr:SulP family inorganic anion transporter [Rickettsiales bacterium]